METFAGVVCGRHVWVNDNGGCSFAEGITEHNKNKFIALQ